MRNELLKAAKEADTNQQRQAELNLKNKQQRHIYQYKKRLVRLAQSMGKSRPVFPVILE